VKTTLRSWLHRGLEPQLLFPALAVIVVGIIWGTTLTYLDTLRVESERSAQISTRDNVETYEAQVVRALDQVDRALGVVAYSHNQPPGRRSLAELRDNDLLPPDLLFIVSIADRNGVIIDSTRTGGPKDLLGRDYFESQRAGDAGLFVGQPPADAGLDARINFSRRLTAPDGSFDGVVVVVVEAEYFVSGYEPTKLGARGLLSLIGTDGRIRVWRSGDTVGVDGSIDYDFFITGGDYLDSPVKRVAGSWDGESRWVSMRPLYGFPLAVMAGLSVDEQRALGRATARRYYWLAAGGSLISALCLALIGRQSWQLQMSRRRESEMHRAHAERVEYLAYHDSLTELPNRALFSRMLTQGVSEARRYKRQLAVAFLDLDRFKAVNDSLGHDAGDQLLIEVAARLNSNVRASDTVARLGGDEFVVLLPEISGPADAAAVAKKILAAMAQPFHLLGRDVRVTASIGISICPQHGIDEQTLKKNADIAMYEAKAEGRNNFQFYNNDLGATTQIEFQRLLAG
jgi:diguanylate cyclase (GGDEF)-like protein